MKKFISRVALVLVLCTAVAVISSYVVDPYNVFHWDNIRDNGVEPNKNYIKPKYILNNPDKFNGLLFGSSRVGAIHVENITDIDMYNMTYSLGTPAEHYGNLKTFIDNNVNIDVVYIGVDSYSYTEDLKVHCEQSIRSPYEYLENPLNVVRLYIDPTLITQSLSTLLKSRNTSKPEIEHIYDYGWMFDYDQSPTVNWETAKPQLGDSYLLKETLQDVKNIKDLCDDNGIELVVFTNPMCELTYNASVGLNYLDFLERLADITDYYNFSGLNDVTTNTDNYLDASHYNAYVGDMMIDVMFNGNLDEQLYSQGFGWYVTKENISELLAMLK